MDKKDRLQERLEHSWHGTPVLKADEKKKYLGTFKERVLFALTKADINNIRKKAKAKEFMKDKRADVVLINSKYITDLSDFIKSSHKKGVGCRIVSRDEKSTEIILVVASKTAI